VSVAAALAAPAVLVLPRIRLWHRDLMRFTHRQRLSVEARQRQAQQDISQLRGQLSLIDAAAGLQRLLEEHAAPSAYKEYRGLLGQVHEDLTRFSAALGRARAEWAAAGSVTAPPLERIVLYIDDLDRCPPRRVVQVLEAVHLMLAGDLFVVVVAVDARWLIRSLQYHHRELFSAPGHHLPDLPAEDAAGQATPIDYLDKIFQIPYALLPPPPGATAAYLRALLPAPAPQAPAPPAEHGTGPGGRLADGGTPGSQPDVPDSMALEQHPEDTDRPGTRYPGPGRPGVPWAGQVRETAAPDLRPQGLQLSRAEIDFMTMLGALVPTPRAAKKLTNLYRLVRISIADAELASFLGNETNAPYQAVQILLAILAGTPTLARTIFEQLLTASAEDDLLTVIAETSTGQAGKTQLEPIMTTLEKISTEKPLPAKAGEYQRWCPALARYSFHTRTLAGLPPDQPAETSP
jgi:KAP family P-loop domain